MQALSVSQVMDIGIESFYIIDIRSNQSYNVLHIENSLHMQTKQQVSMFLNTLSKNNIKPILFVCFSGHKAKDMAKAINNENNEIIIYYLNDSIMSLVDILEDTMVYKIFNLESPPPQQNQLLSNQQNVYNNNKYIDNTNLAQELDLSPNSLILQTMQDMENKYLSSNRAFVIAFSGGKDSTCVLQLFYDMLLRLPANKRRPSFAICSNTLVEPPHIEKFLQTIIEAINTHAKTNNIPFKIIEVTPELNEDFWVNLIGKGYPSPTRTFRWCTDRLKIRPSKKIVAEITQQFGSVILCLGTRKQESTNRKRSMEKRILTEEGYSLHHDFPDTLCYAPISEWTTDDVWTYLSSHKPSWNKTHQELFSLYSQASGDECQFITDLSQNSCGGSRFGCWVCTVVNEDKSMKGFIDSGHENLKPLNEFRNYIKELRENQEARADYKRDGRAVYKVGGLGPFLSHIRIEMFSKLLKAEEEFKNNGGKELISDNQILAIQSQWNKDFDRHQSAIRIAKKFKRLKGVTMPKTKVLHPELLEKIETKYIDTITLEEFIKEIIEIYNTKNKRYTKLYIKEAIEKLLNDKTAKSQ